MFLGSASGVASGSPASAAAQLESDQAWTDGDPGFSPSFGNRVAGVGDVNGDGYADVMVAATEYDAPLVDEGAVFLFLGSASGIADGNPGTAAAQLRGAQAGAEFGAPAAAGDVNGDGFADVIIGAPGYSDGETLEGAAFVFLGSASGIASGSPASAATQLESNQAGGIFGFGVAGAGDVNGDGYADVLVGAPGYDAAHANEGSAFIYLGGASGIASGSAATAAAQLVSDQADALFGWGVAGAGDVDGDGYADLIVSAPFYDSGQTDEGAAFVFLGGASGIASGNPATAAAQLETNQFEAAGLGITPFAFIAMPVAGAGDVNGDGFADVVMGASYYDDNGQTDEGAAFVFLGNTEGRPLGTRQRRGDGSGVPVQPWGTSSNPTAFAVELLASHPDGTGRVRLELEACPPAVPFGDASCTTLLSPGWLTVTGANPEVLVSQTLSGLSSNTLYRWRARVLHAAATGPLSAHPAHGPWRRVNAQATEADIRLLPEPDAVLSLASGIALLAALARARRRDVSALCCNRRFAPRL